MKCITLIPLCFLLCLYVQSVISQNGESPPRGWNSYDSFSWIITEVDFLENARIMSTKRFTDSGYQILDGMKNSIVLSVSPGVKATTQMAKVVSGLVNAYRVTGDDWDEWPAVVDHFNVARDFGRAGLIGAPGLKGNSWPDLDMLPFGWLTDPAVKQGPHRFSRLSRNEKITQMTLWCMAKSPIMYGGDLRKLDAWELNLITNPILLGINSFSSDNMEFYASGSVRSWLATRNDRGEIYVAFFNLRAVTNTIIANIGDLAVAYRSRKLGSCRGREIWSGRTINTNHYFSAVVAPHGSALFVLHCR